jgi:biotin synthase
LGALPPLLTGNASFHNIQESARLHLFLMESETMLTKHDWTFDEIRAIYERPLFDLIYCAAEVHRAHHDPLEIQVCSLISIKTGGCSEDCAYCPQAARYHTDVEARAMMSEEEILSLAEQAVAKGATRVCLGAAWRSVRDSAQFDRIVSVVRKITDRGVEVCCTLGMLSESQAKRLKEAGLYAYNHNLDSSSKFYKTIISTRSYEDRLSTLDAVEQAGISVCCGGIIGMGEAVEDRIELLRTLACRAVHPESVPINLLVPVKGTPLEERVRLPIWDMLRMIATARIIMPKSMIRLSAGRLERSLEEQALCFLAGANSIFSGEKLLTRSNPDFETDAEMFKLFGFTTRSAFAESQCTQ